MRYQDAKKYVGVAEFVMIRVGLLHHVGYSDEILSSNDWEKLTEKLLLFMNRELSKIFKHFKDGPKPQVLMSWDVFSDKQAIGLELLLRCLTSAKAEIALPIRTQKEGSEGGSINAKQSLWT